MIRSASVLCAAALVVAACGTTPQDRGISGAGIGAVGGAIIGAVTGLTVLEGALIGTGLGAAAGVFTDEKKLNLGEPLWKRGLGSSKDQSSKAGAPDRHAAAGAPPARDRRLVAGTQSGLRDMGYDPGPVDGILGPRTRAAIRAYQKDHRLPVDERPTPALALHIRAQLGDQVASQGLSN